jgi:hypothetical protein
MEGPTLLKNIALFAFGLLAVISIGCGTSTTPEQADVSKPQMPEAQAAQAAAKEADDSDAGEDPAATAIPAGNKAAGAPRRPTPSGTPSQQ